MTIIHYMQNSDTKINTWYKNLKELCWATNVEGQNQYKNQYIYIYM